jgi:hypothetical protein
MKFRSFEDAQKQAQANANRSGTPWYVFASGHDWFCEPRVLKGLLTR